MLKIFDQVLDLIFPKYCVSCHTAGDYLCLNCFSQIQFLKTQCCPYCQKMSVDGVTHPLCQKRWRLDGLISVAFYYGPIQSLIKSLKYGRIKDLQGTTKQLLERFLVDEEELFLSDSIVIPVPLHFLKKNFRGFNQAEILAKLVAQMLELKYRADVLVRRRFTASQTRLSKKDRWLNIKDAFEIGAKPESIAGGNFLLIDDVWTTGATIKECSRVLKKNGVNKVWGLTLAREDKWMQKVN